MLASGLLHLGEATGEVRYAIEARRLVDACRPERAPATSGVAIGDLIEVPGGGRFMTSSHPDLVVEQLNRLAVRDYGSPDVSSCQKPTLIHPAGNGGYVPGAVFHP